MNKTIVRRSTSTSNSLTNTNLHPLLANIYAARGIQSLSELETGLEHLLSFTLLKDIEIAANCLADVLRQQQHIMIIGDYDADGATSTALAVSALQNFGATQVSYLVPNRFTYGYGLTPEIVAVAAERKPDILITVDNGIASIAGVAYAKQLGMKVIITDHHLPGTELPVADAIINPNQIGDNFPSKHIAGVGVIFYLMLALRAILRSQNWFAEKNIPDPNMSQLLDLVALGTVSDVVVLDKNNRILVKQGLQRIRQGKARPGIRALLEIAGKNLNHIVTSDLGYIAGPRLNAAGRIDDMSLGIACLLAADENSARVMAVQLDTLNKERQAIEESMQQQARQILANLKLKNNLPVGVCLFDEEWHQGVIGIVASRIKDQLHRPTIAFAKANEQELKGSARSINGLHIRDVLAEISINYPDLISKFGGHAMAAGLSLEKNKYHKFCEIFDKEVRRHLNEQDLASRVLSDGELLPEYFSLEIAKLIKDASPWGQGFSEPIFDGVFDLLEQRIVGQRHLKMTLQIPEQTTLIDAIAFNVDAKVWPNHRAKKIHAAYRLDINEFRGRSSVQLIVEHLTGVGSSS